MRNLITKQMFLHMDCGGKYNFWLYECLAGITLRPVCTVTGSDLDPLRIACNKFQSSLIVSALRFCKVNGDIKMWVCP